MGRYIQSQLLKDEHVEHEAKIHWAIYLKVPLAFLFMLIFVRNAVMPLGYAIMLSLVVAGYAYIQATSTELAVTNKRVIAKFGFIRRFTMDQQLDRVEGVTLDQTILGRILGYATVYVRGTGGMQTLIPLIDQPEQFRIEVQKRLP